jgi:hypothetical protein
VILGRNEARQSDGSGAVHREARAAARRHKNRLRVHRAMSDSVAGFDEIVHVVRSGGAARFSVSVSRMGGASRRLAGMRALA